jgi:hypothetical protein
MRRFVPNWSKQNGATSADLGASGLNISMGRAPEHYGGGFRCRQCSAEDIINLEEDQVLFIFLCNRCAEGTESLGRPVEEHDAKYVVIVV